MICSIRIINTIRRVEIKMREGKIAWEKDFLPAGYSSNLTKPTSDRWLSATVRVDRDRGQKQVNTVRGNKVDGSDRGAELISAVDIYVFLFCFLFSFCLFLTGDVKKTESNRRRPPQM